MPVNSADSKHRWTQPTQGQPGAGSSTATKILGFLGAVANAYLEHKMAEPPPAARTRDGLDAAAPRNPGVELTPPERTSSADLVKASRPTFEVTDSKPWAPGVPDSRRSELLRQERLRAERLRNEKQNGSGGGFDLSDHVRQEQLMADLRQQQVMSDFRQQEIIRQQILADEQRNRILNERR